jgi:hypothetical protein
MADFLKPYMFTYLEERRPVLLPVPAHARL